MQLTRYVLEYKKGWEREVGALEKIVSSYHSNNVALLWS